MDKPTIGSMSWMDITVPDATKLQSFYADVIGWKAKPLSMGDYDDYVMKGEGDSKVGICHARGKNAEIPPVWMPYFVVADLNVALEHCERLGGRRIGEIRSYGETARFCVIQDPQGAHCMLFQS
jgi:predicted enzyme related to lactoylglutathione lyase